MREAAPATRLEREASRVCAVNAQIRGASYVTVVAAAAGLRLPPCPTDAALVDLLGALAYGELCAFDRLADDARMAPTLAGRAEMSAMAAVEFGHYQRLADRLRELGVAPAAAMEPFVAALETSTR